MAGTDYDIIIGGYKAKVARGVEGGGYKRRTIRREIQNNLLSQAEVPALVNREDRLQLYQTSWAGGARWWKPLITPGDLSSYFQANHMDVWSEPGKVVPANRVLGGAFTDLHDNCIIAVGAGTVYAIGSTVLQDAVNLDVYVWTPASDAFVRDVGLTSGIAAAENPMAMVYDPSDGYFYTISDGSDLERFQPSGNTQNADWITTGFTARVGTNIFLQNQNLMFYDGEKVYTVTKATPAVTSVFNDGMGPDLLENATQKGGAGALWRNNLHLAISTPEGVYYVKNTRQGSQPMAWVFRVERDAAGNWLGNPIATLPVGSVALGITYHLGQLVISASPDWQAILDNNTNEAEVVLYFVGEGGMGVLGSVLGGRDELDETPFRMLGSKGQYIYIGGQKRLWLYDGVRGGLHTVFTLPTELSNGPINSMFFEKDSADNDIMVLAGIDVVYRQKDNKADDPDTVVNFGDDETHYTLESNFFDGGLPMDEKEITEVIILKDKDDGGSEWTVQISADDGAFVDALVSSDTSIRSVAQLSGTSGYQFRYRLIYQTKDAARKALRALLVTMTTGDMVTEWDIMLDGSELLNVDNELQDEETFFDNMKTLADEQSIVTLVDNFQEQGQETSTTDVGVKVKVVAVEIAKEKPGESMVRLLVREA